MLDAEGDEGLGGATTSGAARGTGAIRGTVAITGVRAFPPHGVSDAHACRPYGDGGGTMGAWNAEGDACACVCQCGAGMELTNVHPGGIVAYTG